MNALTSLHDKLESTILTRQKLALACTPGPWRGEPISVHMNGSAVSQIEGENRKVVAKTTFWRSADLAHVVINGPSNTIRQCERDLRVLQRHAIVSVHTNIGELDACKHDWANGDGWVTPYPCHDMQDLAHAYDVT